MVDRLTRSQAIAADCRECTYDPAAAGTWREQVSICACVGCPLWPYRPLATSAPMWIKSRAPSDLPEGFHRLGGYTGIFGSTGGGSSGGGTGTAQQPWDPIRAIFKSTAAKS